jgi:hypothetical protein
LKGEHEYTTHFPSSLADFILCLHLQYSLFYILNYHHHTPNYTLAYSVGGSGLIATMTVLIKPAFSFVLCWCVWVPVGACWCLLVPVGACWAVLPDARWCWLVPVGACVGACRCMLGLSGAVLALCVLALVWCWCCVGAVLVLCWCFLVLAGACACRCLSVYVGVCWYMWVIVGTLLVLAGACACVLVLVILVNVGTW